MAAPSFGKEGICMIVGPITETNVPVIYYTDASGYAGPTDMDGLQIGVAAYSEPGDNLHVKINLEFGKPNTRYEAFLVSGGNE